jgi:hypothetical protein
MGDTEDKSVVAGTSAQVDCPKRSELLSAENGVGSVNDHWFHGADALGIEIFVPRCNAFSSCTDISY